MSTEEFVDVVSAVTALLGVLVWPVVLLFALVRFGPAIGTFLANLREFAVKGPGFEATATRSLEVAAALGGAVAANSNDTDEQGIRAPNGQARDVANLVAAMVTPSSIERAREKTILWVDDHPENNRREREAFAAMGFRLVLSTSTEDALDRVSERPFDAIISDMGRTGDSSAGYALLDALRERGERTPFFIYAGSNRHAAEARQRGAQGSTNRPDELLRMVTSSVTMN